MSLEDFAESRSAAEIVGALLEGERLWGPAAIRRLREGFLSESVSRAPLQNGAICIPDLTPSPWLDVADVPLAAALERSWPSICRELEAFANGADFNIYQQDSGSFLDLEHWTAADICKLGRWHANSEQIPETANILKLHGAPVEMAFLSRLSPGGDIRRHCGPWNTRLTVHLCLTAPSSECWIRVGEERRRWYVGRCLVFDDSFEHECRNEGDSDRIVLLVDVWNPRFTAPELEVLKHILRLLSRDYWRNDGGPGTFEPEDGRYVLLRRTDDRYAALWPSGFETPKGWRRISSSGSRAECLDRAASVGYRR